MSVKQSTLVEIRRVPGKGRGVFATQFIPCEAVIERVPVLVVPEADVLTDEWTSGLAEFVFGWGKTTVALALGYGSLYNHSYSPNARYDDVGQRTKIFTAIRDIQPGEEITINYNGDPDDKTMMEFDVV